MEDRELLEWAAKVAGYDVVWNESWGAFQHRNPVPDNHGGMRHPWVPLDDDGDALRLAVKLKIHHRQYSNQVQIRGCWFRDGYIEAVMKDIEEREPINGDPYAATRRAIVLAAAEIGRRVK